MGLHSQGALGLHWDEAGGGDRLWGRTHCRGWGPELRQNHPSFCKLCRCSRQSLHECHLTRKASGFCIPESVCTLQGWSTSGHDYATGMPHPQLKRRKGLAGSNRLALTLKKKPPRSYHRTRSLIPWFSISPG